MFERNRSTSLILPIHPLKDQVLFPHMIISLFVQADSMPLIEEVQAHGQQLGLVACTDPGPGCRFEVVGRIGTLGQINQIFRFPEGGCKVVVEGTQRIRVFGPTRVTPFLASRVELIEEKTARSVVSDALVQSVNTLLKIALAYGRPLPGDVLKMVDQIEEPGQLADLVAVYLTLEVKVQQHLLETLDPVERLKEVYLHLTSEVQKLQVRGEIQTEVAKRLGKTQKEYLLREQMKQIQEELGNEDPRQAELSDFRKRIDKSDMPEKVLEAAEKELSRLERTNPSSPEYAVSRSYLDCLCNIPWNRGSTDCLEIESAQKILDEDHYDLIEVKERILEYLAVRSLKGSGKGPILCFVGPPGVGKTSLGRSIAKAMGRQFIRMSLGGMKDEAEIRGHRRTYIGAMPGRILQEICRVETNNPVFMLDEVDKIGQDFRGDPSSALLEVLDPEQNFSFNDHYLDLPFDLSRVMFITTANLLDPIPHALRDRMEVIRLSGYSDEEKLQIAYKYLIPKQLAENGLSDNALDFERAAVLKIIKDYTREAGVRNVEREIASVCRKVAKDVVQHHPARRLIAPADVEELLGPRRFFTDVAGEEDRIGVVTGLAWTESGGDILFIEATRMSGSKDLILTGSLGDVMQESARAALSYVRSHCGDFSIQCDFFEHSDIHIHVPSGAIPKDGPSAGVTIAIALISLLSERPARRDVAMTGELTLSGRLLPIGGVKEKVLAARRAGVRTVLLPEHNREHLREIEKDVLADMEILFVENLKDVVKLALLPSESARSQGIFDDRTSTPSLPSQP